MKKRNRNALPLILCTVLLLSSLPIPNANAESANVCCESVPVELFLLGSATDGTLSPFSASLAVESVEVEITDSVAQNQEIAIWKINPGAPTFADFPESTWEFNIEYEVNNAGGVQINASIEIEIGSETYVGSTDASNAFLPVGKGTLSIDIPVEAGTLPSSKEIVISLVARTLVFSVPGTDAGLTFRWGSADDESTIFTNLPLVDLIIEEPVTEGMDVYISVVVVSPWGALTVAHANILTVSVNGGELSGDPIETMSGEFIRVTWTWRDSQEDVHNITIDVSIQVQSGTPTKSGSAEFTITTIDDGSSSGGVFYPSEEPLRTDGAGSPISVLIEMDLEIIDGQMALSRTTTLSLDQEIAYWMRWGMDNIGNEDPSLSQSLRIFSGYGGYEDNLRNKMIDEGEINQFEQQMKNLAVTYMNDGMAIEIEELIGDDLIEFERVDFDIDLLGETKVTPYPLVLTITTLEVVEENKNLVLLRNFIIVQPTPIWSTFDLYVDIDTAITASMTGATIKGANEIDLTHRRGLTGETIEIVGMNLDPGVTFTISAYPSANLLNAPMSLNLLVMLLLGGGFWLALRTTRYKRRSALWLELALAPVVLLTLYLAYSPFTVGAVAIITVSMWMLTAVASPVRKEGGPTARSSLPEFPSIDCPACEEPNSITSLERPFRLPCSGCGRVLKIVE